MLFNCMKSLRQKRSSIWSWSTAMEVSSSTTSSGIPDSQKSKLANFISSLFPVLSISTKAESAIEISSLKICCWIMILLSRLSILVSVTCTSREQLSRQPVGLLAMLPQKWSLERDTTDSELIFGVVELYFMPWCVDIYHSKIQKHPTSIRKLWVLNIHSQSSYQDNAKIW